MCSIFVRDKCRWLGGGQEAELLQVGLDLEQQEGGCTGPGSPLPVPPTDTLATPLGMGQRRPRMPHGVPGAPHVKGSTPLEWLVGRWDVGMTLHTAL